MMRSMIAAGALALACLTAAATGAQAQYSPSAQCRANCERILDRSRTVNSAALQRQHQACMAGCARRAAAESAYRSCMANAKGNKDAIARCRAAYTANR